MLGSIKAWLAGLSVAGKIGVGVATFVAATAIIGSAAPTCDKPIEYKTQTETVSIPFTIQSIKDGSLEEGSQKTKVAGVNGQKKVTYKVGYKCTEQKSKQKTKEVTTKEPITEQLLVGTKYRTTESVAIHFGKKNVYDSTLASGKTKVTMAGIDGEKTLTYEIYQNEGKPEVKKLIKTEITKPPVDEVLAIGTYVAPASSSSSSSSGYTNVSGNHVQSPSNNPSGATAQCNDGTYSYSQHHSGTCSHHGGVARWL